MAAGYRLIRPLLWLLEAESAHDLAVWALIRGLVPGGAAPDNPLLAVDLWGRRFGNPIGMAAGFDKDARAIGPIFGLGAGFVEVGSVTPCPQAGNPRPRLFRLSEDEAVINRMGFNNRGMAAMRERLTAWTAEGRPGVVGVNIGKNKDSPDAAADYRACTERLADLAGYLVVNVSSPNTPGLRALQSRAALEEILSAVRRALEALPPDRRPPLLLKVAPDLTDNDKQDIVAVALDFPLDGLIVSNTTIARPAGLAAGHRAEAGGLSGRPLFAPSTALLGEFHKLTQGRVPLIGVGGVFSGADAYAKIRAGATLVQLYSAMVYGGPGLIGRIKRELADLLRRDGFNRLQDAVGAGRA